MLFKKLLPREGNFFELFDQHAERILEAAQACASSTRGRWTTRNAPPTA